MIELIAVREPTEIQLAEWLKSHRITFQQHSEQMNRLKPPIEIYGENGKRMIPNYSNRMVAEYAKAGRSYRRTTARKAVTNTSGNYPFDGA